MSEERKQMTLEQVRELFIQELEAGRVDRERVINAIRDQELESMSDYSHAEWIEWAEDVIVEGVPPLREADNPTLWTRTLDSWCIDGEQDWADQDLRELFVLWLEDEMGIEVPITIEPEGRAE